jgi:hypothetical protein
MPETVHLGLPLIESGQAQKHVTHNEALVLLDATLHLSVLSQTLNAPPASPQNGDRFLVEAPASGAWAGHAGDLAVRQDNAWRFLTPVTGWRIWVEAESKLIVFDGTAWQDVGGVGAGNLQDVDHVGINTTADNINRLAVSSPASLFTHEGSDHRLKINKSAAANTASLIFQDTLSGRAELGLTGDDNLHVKVSANGTAWTEALTIDRTTGRVAVPQGLADNSIGNTALADMPAARLKGAVTAGDPADLTGTQATALLDVFTSTAKGLAPPSGGGAVNFLRADGSWAPPSGGSTAPVMGSQLIQFGRLTAIGAGGAALKPSANSYTSITLGTQVIGAAHFTVSGDRLVPSAVPSNPLYRWTGCTVTGPGGTSNPFTLTIETVENAYSIATAAELQSAVTAIGTASVRPVTIYGRNADLGTLLGWPDLTSPFLNKAFVNTVTLASHDPTQPLKIRRLQIAQTQNVAFRNILFQSQPAVPQGTYAGYSIISIEGPAATSILFDACEICGDDVFDVLSGAWATSGFWGDFVGVNCANNGSGYPGDIAIRNCHFHDIGIGASMRLGSGSAVFTGNTVRRFFSQAAQFGVVAGYCAPVRCSFNDCGLIFSLASDPNNPHAENFQCFAGGATVNWTDIEFIGNRLWVGNTRGNGQGIFLSDMPAGLFFTFKAIGNLVETGQFRSISVNRAMNCEITGNTCAIGATGNSVSGGLIDIGSDATSGVNIVRDNIGASYGLYGTYVAENNIDYPNSFDFDYPEIFSGPWMVAADSAHVTEMYRIRPKGPADVMEPKAGCSPYVDYARRSFESPRYIAPTAHTHTTATSTVAGFMAAADKAKLDGVAANANNYAHPNHSGDVTSAGDGATTIASNAVSDAKLRDSAASSVIGRSAATAGDPADIIAGTADTALLFTGGVVQFGKISGSQLNGSTLANSKLATMPAGTIKANNTAGATNPADLTSAQVTAMLDTFTGAAKGLAPASGGGTTNFLRADGQWAPPPGGGGGGSGDVLGPASANDNAIARFDATTGKIIQNSGVLVNDDGTMILPVPAAPATPAADTLAVFARARGGRILPAFMGPSGLDSTLQPFLGFNRIMWVTGTGNSTTIAATGIATSANGTATARAFATTNLFTSLRRVGFVSAATAGSATGLRSAIAQFWRGNAPGLGGFMIVWRFAHSDATLVANAQTWVGLAATTTAMGATAPSALLNQIGMGHDTGDADFRIMHNDATGVATEIPLGASFPAQSTNTDVYELVLFCAPNGSEVKWQATRLNTGDMATGTITTDLPASATLLAPQMTRNNGGTAAAVGIDLINFYGEVDY